MGCCESTRSKSGYNDKDQRKLEQIKTKLDAIKINFDEFKRQVEDRCSSKRTTVSSKPERICIKDRLQGLNELDGSFVSTEGSPELKKRNYNYTFGLPSE